MLLLLTFFMRQMVPLRAVAIASSMAWLVFGFGEHVVPVAALHVVLLPLNSYRLFQSMRDRGPGAGAASNERTIDMMPRAVEAETRRTNEDAARDAAATISPAPLW